MRFRLRLAVLGLVTIPPCIGAACGSNSDKLFDAAATAQSSGPGSCSCFNATTLIGTCTEPEAMNPHCDNTQGCCSAFYCASMGG